MKAIGTYKETLPLEVRATRSIHDDLQNPLNADDRRLLADYLEAAPVIAATSPGFIDVMSGAHVSESYNFHSNGIECWTADLAYYVRTYGLNPGEEILQHARQSLGLNMTPQQIERIAEEIQATLGSDDS